MHSANEELKRFGIEPESATDLALHAASAERILGIHGVSVTARATSAAAGRALRDNVEQVFRVHNTSSRRDKLHRTIELPKPVTDEVANQFNQLFGRG